MAEAKVGSGVTLSAVIDYLRKEGEELDNGVFKVLISIGENRSQLVFVLPSEDDDGDADFDDLRIWSNFAGVDEVALKKLLEVDGWGFGFQELGDFFAVQMAIRPWQLRDMDALDQVLIRLAAVADEYERTLIGTDDY